MHPRLDKLDRRIAGWMLTYGHLAHRLALVPTPEGQYLIKDLVLFTAALIVGGTVRSEPGVRIRH